MSFILLKNVKFDNKKIYFEYRSSNVYPHTFYKDSMDNTAENMERMKEYLVQRVWMPCGSGKRLYKKLGITHYYDGKPITIKTWRN